MEITKEMSSLVVLAEHLPFKVADLEKAKKLAQIKIVVTADAGHATDARKFVSEMIKAIEDVKKRLTAPLRQKTKVINDSAKALIEPLEAVKTHINGELLAWRAEERARAAEEQKRLAAEAEELERKRREAAEEEAARVADALGMDEEEGAALVEEQVSAVVPVVPRVPEAPKRIVGDLGRMHFRDKWEFEVIDLSKVPDAFKMINKKAVDAQIAAGVRDIEGLRIFSREIPVGR